MNWEKVKFGDLFLEPTRNGVYKSPDAHGSGCKIVNMGEIFAYDFIGNQEMQRISMTAEELEKSGLKENDLLFARRSLVESGAGKVSIVTALNEPLTFESSIIRVRLNENICFPLFYLYWMRSHAGRTAISALITGTNVKGIRGSALKDIDVDYPKYSTQKKIADIISAYDTLIENNQKQISLLEEAAQRLYKEWFVDMRFPGHETTKIIDGVPEGWSFKAIKEVCVDLYSGGTPSRSKKEYWENGTINWFKTQELNDCWLFTSIEKISDDGLQNSSAKIFPRNSILMAIYASPTVGRLGILSGDASCNQAAVGLIANEEIVSYEWLYLTLYYLRESFNSIARGAGQQNINVGIVKEQEILVPTNHIMSEFKTIVSPIFLCEKYLQKQIVMLTEARDRLLPKLMSGEIEVKA